ncbi:MAG TPA: hypothetical protein VF006_15595 [Longimicrobium sp.]
MPMSAAEKLEAWTRFATKMVQVTEGGSFPGARPLAGSHTLAHTLRVRKAWAQIVTKYAQALAQAAEGSFPGARPLAGSYWQERRDPHHRPTTVLNPLWVDFVKDRETNGRDFYAWLQNQPEGQKKVVYLKPHERGGYQITFAGNRIVFSEEAKSAGIEEYDAEIIYVVDHSDVVYCGEKSVGLFHHSSMLSGAPVKGAGTMKRIGCLIMEVNNHSGHYQPGHKELVNTARAMEKCGADLALINMVRYGAKNLIEWKGTARQLLEEEARSAQSSSSSSAASPAAAAPTSAASSASAAPTSAASAASPTPTFAASSASPAPTSAASSASLAPTSAASAMPASARGAAGQKG